jgi:hypothetical protein
MEGNIDYDYLKPILASWNKAYYVQTWLRALRAYVPYVPLAE